MIDTLAGIRVVEQGTFITGPCAGMMLADLGADVIKIESPEGDPYRSYQGGQYSPHFQAYNRNKRSLALDLKAARDRELFEQLIREADVFIQNFRPGTAERLGAGRAAWFEADVTDIDALRRAVDGTAERFGGIDVAIANAGLAFMGPLSSAPVGSSAKSTSGALATARAMATRCCSPPESSDGRCEARLPICM